MIQLFRFTFFAIIILSLYQAPLHAQNIVEDTLHNGMKVIIIPDNKTSGIMHSLWYKAGSKNDPIGKSGTAHFLEHMMFKGTRKFKIGEFHRTIGSSGGYYNAFTHVSCTAYYEKIVPAYLEKVMELESDRMLNLVLDENEIDLERKVVLSERRMRIDNDPEAVLSERLKSLMYRHHPYGQPIIGWEQEIYNINKEDLQKFYNQYYQPSNAILIISGSIDPEYALTMAKKYYGKLENTQQIKNVEMAQIDMPGKVTLKMNSALGKRQWSRYYKAPGITQNNLPKILDLLIGAYILGEGQSSRLYKELVIKKKVATDISIEYSPRFYNQNTIFAIHATPTQNTDLQTLISEYEHIIQEFLESEEIAAKEIERARGMIMADIIYSQEGLQKKSYQYGISLVNGMSLQDIDLWHKYALQEIDANKIRNAINEITQYSIDGYLSNEE